MEEDEETADTLISNARDPFHPAQFVWFSWRHPSRFVCFSFTADLTLRPLHILITNKQTNKKAHPPIGQRPRPPDSPVDHLHLHPAVIPPSTTPAHTHTHTRHIRPDTCVNSINTSAKGEKKLCTHVNKKNLYFKPDTSKQNECGLCLSILSSLVWTFLSLQISIHSLSLWRRLKTAASGNYRVFATSTRSSQLYLSGFGGRRKSRFLWNIRSAPPPLLSPLTLISPFVSR